MLDRSRRRWTSITATLGRRLLFAGRTPNLHVHNTIHISLHSTTLHMYVYIKNPQSIPGASYKVLSRLQFKPFTIF